MVGESSLLLPKIAYKDVSYGCQKCKQDVTFGISITQFTNDLGVYAEKFRDVKAFGKCLVASESKIPNHPSRQEWNQCPFSHETHRLV